MKKRKDRKSTAWPPIRVADPDELYRELVRRHPQYRRALERGETMMEGGQEVNPALHLQLHLLVEQQILGGEPDFVAQAARRLEQAAVHPHTVRHLLAEPMIHHLLAATKEEAVYDEVTHRQAVEAILWEHL